MKEWWERCSLPMEMAGERYRLAFLKNAFQPSHFEGDLSRGSDCQREFLSQEVAKFLPKPKNQDAGIGRAPSDLR
jgi:hypothetical protein